MENKNKTLQGDNYIIVMNIRNIKEDGLDPAFVYQAYMNDVLFSGDYYMFKDKKTAIADLIKRTK